MEAKELSERIVSILENRKALDIENIAVREKTSLADYFVICSATSLTHVKTLADELEFQLARENGIQPLGTEGRSSGRWILLDYETVIVHIFLAEERSFYDLDQLWLRKRPLQAGEARSEMEENTPTEG